MNSNNFGIKLLKVVAIALVFGLVAGGVFAGVNFAVNKITGNKTVAAAGSSIEGTAVSTASTMSDVSDVTSNVLPSIVAVTNISLTQYRTLFGTSVQETPSAGSGVIFAKDNDNLYIVTNNHVVENASSLTVTFIDESAVNATIVGTSATDDLAVISVKLSDISSETQSKIKIAVIGDSNELVPGDGALVIGNALGYGQSVTTGVISALNRKVSAVDNSGRQITNTVIQTDAAVNPGNSGGALLNMKGEVVGIVSAKLSSTAIEGVGYAIPSSTVSTIISEIMDKKDGKDTSERATSDTNNNTASGAYLGIAGIDITHATAKQYGLPTGVYVSKVYSGGAAEKAGISQSDVITGLDGKTLTSMSQIKSTLASKNPGDKMTLTVAKASSNYKTTQVEVTLGSSQ